MRPTPLTRPIRGNETTLATDRQEMAGDGDAARRSPDPDI